MLRQVYDRVQTGQENAPGLYDSLKEAAYGQLERTSTGRMLWVTSGNGHETRFSIPGNHVGLTPLAVTELFEEFLTAFEDAQAELGGTPTDQQVFQQMMGVYLRSVRGYLPNWMYLAK